MVSMTDLPSMRTHSVCISTTNVTLHIMSGGAAETNDDEVAATVLASRALIGVAARSLAVIEDKITLTQYRALVVLSSRGDRNVGELAALLAVHPSTATRLCDRLESKGFITRNLSPDNRREMTVKLTVAGARLVRAVTTRRREEIAEILNQLCKDDRDVLRNAFELFGAAAGERPDDAWKLGWTP